MIDGERHGGGAPLRLYGHPFSSYCWKAQIALYEKGLVFDYRVLAPDDPVAAAEWAALWPLRKMPVLVDGGRTVVEASIIVEHLDRRHPVPLLIPADADAALATRTLDRVFDNYIMTPMQKIVGDALRAAADRDPFGVAGARTMLDTAYAWLEGAIAARGWAAGAAFGLADCAAAPALFYADWAHPMAGRFPAVAAYRGRLLARPSVARAVEEARPFRAFFPLGAPDRD